MIELSAAIPDPDVLLALEPEELAAKMLFLLRCRHDTQMFNPGNCMNELWDQHFGRSQYPRERKPEIDLALAEAFAWLEAQGLIVPADGMKGNSGWRHLSRRARKFENETDFRNFIVSRRLSKDTLHAKISDGAWQPRSEIESNQKRFAKIRGFNQRFPRNYVTWIHARSATRLS